MLERFRCLITRLHTGGWGRVAGAQLPGSPNRGRRRRAFVTMAFLTLFSPLNAGASDLQASRTPRPTRTHALSSSPSLLNLSKTRLEVLAREHLVQRQSSPSPAPSLDVAPPYHVACAALFCVAVDSAGHAITSSDPTGGAASWTPVTIDPLHRMTDVACAASGLCAAADDSGYVFTSTDPKAGPAAWQKREVSTAGAVVSISCPSAVLCVAVDQSGALYTSTDPADASSDSDLR
jgi:hypothetical protein